MELFILVALLGAAVALPFLIKRFGKDRSRETTRGPNTGDTILRKRQ